MPRIVIRPLPFWNETTISNNDTAQFWEEINAYWASTTEAMDEQAGNSTASDGIAIKDDKFRSDPKGRFNYSQCPFRSRDLFRVHECLAKFASYLNQSSTDEPGCPVIFDSWKCWPAAQPGQTLRQNCPDFRHLGFDKTRFAYKECTASGHWWRHPLTNSTWSNYTQCVNIQDLNFRQTVNIISLSGLGISLFALLLSLLIFFYFKNLNCGRIKMHKNLFVALAMNNLCWILWYTCVLYKPDVWKSNPPWCRVLHVVKNYFMLSTYSWMLGEGTYLQLLLVNTWRVKTWQIWTIIVSCWTLPLLSVVPYAMARASSEQENKSCWMDTGSSIWFLGIPVIIIMTVNLIFVINVIRVIKRKRGLQTENSGVNSPSQASTMKAARAALMLVPILGLHFILLPIRPDPGSILEYIYEIVSAVSTSFQGFLVSLLFCFLNSEARKYEGRLLDGTSMAHSSGGHRNRKSSTMLMTETCILTTTASPSVTMYESSFSNRNDVTQL